MHQQKLKRLRYKAHVQSLFAGSGLGAVPDLQFTVKWHCDSDFIPFLSRLAPHDTIIVYKSRVLNLLRIDFNQPSSGAIGQGSSESGFRAASNGKRPMSLLFKEGAVQLVDHSNKTISCDLYDLLAVEGQTREEDTFDGQAFELANSTTISESQEIKVLTDVEVQKDLSRAFVKRKIEIVLQQWERHRRTERPAEQQDHLDNPQQDECVGPAPPFVDTLITEKQLSIDVQLRRERHMKQSHIFEILELLSTIYPEVRKVTKLARVLMNSEMDEYVASEIKVPVVSSLGIKAVVQIGQVDHAPFSDGRADEIFLRFSREYQHLGNTSGSNNDREARHTQPTHGTQ